MFFMMKKYYSITFLAIFIIFIASCAVESEYMASLPKIDGFEVNKIYRLNTKLLAAYIDSSGNSLVFKFNENRATWKRILYKTKVAY